MVAEATEDQLRALSPSAGSWLATRELPEDDGPELTSPSVIGHLSYVAEHGEAEGVDVKQRKKRNKSHIYCCSFNLTRSRLCFQSSCLLLWSSRHPQSP